MILTTGALPFRFYLSIPTSIINPTRGCEFIIFVSFIILFLRCVLLLENTDSEMTDELKNNLEIYDLIMVLFDREIQECVYTATKCCYFPPSFFYFYILMAKLWDEIRCDLRSVRKSTIELLFVKIRQITICEVWTIKIYLIQYDISVKINWLELILYD